MKKIVLSITLLAAGAILALVVSHAPLGADSSGCYNCGSGSSANQCRYYGNDTSEQRKKCESMGCKITGTSSCSTAANVKVIN